MDNQKIKQVKTKIMAELLQLNTIEAKCVLSHVNQAIQQGSLLVNVDSKPTKRKSKVELDRDLYEFILSLDLDFLTQKDVRAACIAKFGSKRTPSRTSINRAFRSGIFDR
ncbi:primosomal protein [Vibrio cholerae]|uniref:hypothetical protein n=1 Tax=Vibrio cholerae TaxID=666 RepID=UPI000615B342|nr:hypothetical protein [Vibrio cholerae]AKB07656.1 hypothetical protein VAB027_3144 [Vibrio cholerae]GHW89639.1 primosomal protein [Vibrio cholerae]GHY93240.1 primosomal protein [Vibrio cholerae]